MEWNSIFKSNNEDIKKLIDSFGYGIYKSELYESMGAERLVSEMLLSDKSGICYVAPSGSGKTTLFCKLAEVWSKDNLVFLTGLNFRLESETSIYNYVKEYLSENYGIDFSNNMDDFISLLISEKRKCIIMLDGVDECANLSKMKEALHYAIVRFTRGPVKLIINCRTEIWNTIVNHTWLSSLQVIFWKADDERALFRDPHYNVTLHNYFSKYMISGKISEKNREMCRYPGLIRLFSECNRGAVLNEFESIRYIDLYIKLISKVYSSLMTSLSHVNQKIIIATVECIVLYFWEKGTYCILQEELSHIVNNVSGTDGIKIYKALVHLSLLKETQTSQGVFVTFVHQLIIEYLIANTISKQKLWINKTHEIIMFDITTFVKENAGNQLFLPVLEFFLPILELMGKHHAYISALKKNKSDKSVTLMLCRAITKMGQVDIESWQLLRELENSADPDIKAEVASTVYLLNENIPGDQVFHSLMLIQSKDDAYIQRSLNSRFKFDSNLLMFIKQIQPYCTIPEVQSDLIEFVTRLRGYPSATYRLPMLNLTDLISGFNPEVGLDNLYQFAEFTKDDTAYLDAWVNVACNHSNNLYVRLLKTFINVVRNDRLMWDRIFRFCIIGGKKDPAATFKLLSQGFESMNNINIMISTLKFIGFNGVADPDSATNIINQAWKKTRFLPAAKQMEVREKIADTAVLCFKKNNRAFSKVIQELANGDDLFVKEKITSELKKMQISAGIEKV